MTLNINANMTFIAFGVQVTEYEMLCGSNVPVLFPFTSLSESILY